MSWVKSVAGDDEFDLHFDCVTFYLTTDGLWVVIGDVPQTRNVVKCLLLTKSRWSVVTLYGSCSLCTRPHASRLASQKSDINVTSARVLPCFIRSVILLRVKMLLFICFCFFLLIFTG